MLCPYCGENQGDDSLFCRKCGKKIPKCPSCGMVLTERKPFCANDGTRIPGDILELIPEKNPPVITAEKPKTTNIKTFCIKCGKLCNNGETLCDACKEGATVQVPLKSEKAKKSSRLPLIIVIVSLVTVLAVSAVLLAVHKNYIPVSDFAGNLLEFASEAVEEQIEIENKSPEEDRYKEEDGDEDYEKSYITGSENTEAEARETETEITEEQTEAPVPAYNNNTADKIPVSGFSKAVSSSQLADQGSFSYSPMNVLDGNAATAWCEGISGTGEGEWIEIQSDYVETIHKVGILNGYRADTSLYEKNGKVVAALLSFSDGSSQTVKFDTVDNDGYTYFNIGTKHTSFVRITLLSCESGSKYEDICISEIKVY